VNLPLEEINMFQPRIGVMYRREAIRKRLLDCQIVKSSNLLITPGGNWDKIHCIINEYSYMIKISFCAKTEKVLRIKIPVGFPSSSRRMSPPSTFSGRLLIRSRTAQETQRAWPSTRLSEIRRPFSNGSESRSAFGVSCCQIYTQEEEPSLLTAVGNFASGHLV